MESNEIKIRLNGIDEVKKFIDFTSPYISDIEVVAADGTIIDGKSILGLFSINLLQDLHVRIITDDIFEKRKFDAEMEEFIK